MSPGGSTPGGGTCGHRNTWERMVANGHHSNGTGVLVSAPLPARLGRVIQDEKQCNGVFTAAARRSAVARTGPLQLTETWTYALAGGLLALPFIALEVWRSPERIALGMLLVGSVLAGYLIKRRGGNSTATGLRAALIGGLPLLWALGELLWAVPNVPNPPWFRAVSVATALAFGGLMLAVVAAFGALAGRFGGWLAERRGHSGGANADGRSP